MNPRNDVIGEAWYDIPANRDEVINNILDEYKNTIDVMEKDMLLCRLEAILKDRGIL